MIYYWDDRDGEESAGWWIGIGVGGATVWARHKDAENFPPETGWLIPFHPRPQPTAL